MKTKSQPAIENALRTLVAHAKSAGAPDRVAEEARRATAERFTATGAAGGVAVPRVESYFWGVVRRRALAGGAPAIARLIVAASMATEMGESGHSGDVFARIAI